MDCVRKNSSTWTFPGPSVGADHEPTSIAGKAFQSLEDETLRHCDVIVTGLVGGFNGGCAKDVGKTIGALIARHHRNSVIVDLQRHTGASATDSAKSVQAHAYTVGSDIVFQGDRYSPGTAEGQRMLAHELTHVVQQRSGPVDGTPAGGGISVSDPSDRFEREAEATADRVMSGDAVSATAAGGPDGSSVQREDAPEEEPVQALSIQRQDAPEEETEEG